ncbi:histidine phosphatase family protein [Phaeobacter gallaeciensis]|uniref:Fructose-2,6-bisphosphatase n=1 Tax=Phaeobacter gallaeciensis TaxID=60890 RepID=A0AAC9ZB40_9RHOB|nr:histidine phosphatase family protein [Phaeobacter gallaeciensis]AHD10858.1 Fructose-2,6-bisphosphatase [Phaeobacter gallaeciensis DSM 26640]ATE94121.1 Fructose-2,6-bisphosphatase [Phaeobacter gallaeciensis]ATE96058.1 Fructose-2,6-bisphosphatase [Phaeobacter gallaeciensis]ATF02785.1 Fructose-2,6-bisphosphatase [Phaeobacter gallaeciensis]ATF07165.1 Fructose-2,6-bisphosphatase [Phaeobacter gallaeciensis]
MQLTPQTAIYVTHPQVIVDTQVQVTEWQLSVLGAERVDQLAKRVAALSSTCPVAVVCSGERKAIETAKPLANALGVDLEQRHHTHENDRSSTGFLPPDAFERQADAFFANPARSVRGWETAQNAQARILREMVAAEADHEGCALIICGHGAVGTLLYCALAGQKIDRRWDQPPGGGNWFAYDRRSHSPLSHWAPIETLFVDQNQSREKQ